MLLLIKANHKWSELLSESQVSEDDTWAHLEVFGKDRWLPIDFYGNEGKQPTLLNLSEPSK